MFAGHARRAGDKILRGWGRVVGGSERSSRRKYTEISGGQVGTNTRFKFHNDLVKKKNKYEAESEDGLTEDRRSDS